MIRKMCMEDLVVVDKIEKESFSDPYRMDQYEYELNDSPVSCLYVYEKDGEIVGFIDFWITFEACQLTKLAVAKKARKQGIASEMIDFMVEEAEEQGCEAIFLEVRKSNLAAQKLYEKHDFLEINIRKEYYPDNYEDAIVMGKVIGGYEE